MLKLKIAILGYVIGIGLTAYLLCLRTEQRPKILVATGLGYDDNKTELWRKPESQCALPDFPIKVVLYAVGFWTAQGPTVCGGDGGGKKCFIYKEHQWMPWTNMRKAKACCLLAKGMHSV